MEPTLQGWRKIAAQGSRLALAANVAAISYPAFADFEGSLRGLRNQLTGVVLPLVSVIGVGIAAMSFFTGNPNSKQHIFYAILGCIFGFGAQSIVDFIAQSVR